MSRKRKGKAAIGVVLLLISGGVLFFVFFNSQEGKKLVVQMEPPVEISLTPYAFFNGYYVNVTNTSANTTIFGAVVTYTGTSGNARTQTIGTLWPQQTYTLDPYNVQWMAEKHESVSVSANGYLTKTIDTTILLDR